MTLTPILKGVKFSDRLEEKGIEWGTDRHRQMLEKFLTRPTDKFCKCGTSLVYFQTAGMMCEKCIAALDARLDAKEEENAIMARINVPPQYRHCKMASWKGKVPEPVNKFLEAGNTKPLLIFGPDTGVGKTHLATAALYSIANSGLSAWWFSAVSLAMALSAEIIRDREVMFKSSRVKCLLVDDFGREVGVAIKAQELVASILDIRYENNLPTIVTTNKTDEELCAYDARLGSRLLSGHVVHLAGEDKRWEGEQTSLLE